MGAPITLKLAWATALLAVHAGAAAAPAVEIRMHPVVEVPAGQVLLGDAAVIHATDLPTIASLVSLPLGSAPAAGRETIVRRESIVRWVRTRTGLGAGDISWAGSDEIVVRGREGGAAPSGRPAAVRKGDWALLRAHAGAIEIEDRVEILQDGSAGDLVQVRGSTSSGAFAVRVVTRGVVEATP
jgi:hypothetical protein